MEKRTFKVCSVFDTETTNLGEGKDTRAVCILYIFNDLRNVHMKDYSIDAKLDDIRFYRWQDEALEYLEDLISWGIRQNLTPIVCGYNLMFDMVTLMEPLAERYEMAAMAQSSTNVYTLDLIQDGVPVLRFWDTFFLETNGLAAMGRTCGLPKAVGDWDYSLVRAPQTPLTEQELFYAGRDTQVIPAYLRWLLDANHFLDEGILGVRCLTKSSVVRLMAAAEIGPLEIKTEKRGKQKLATAFTLLCKQELPKSYNSYAIRKACFRGGFTFTSANWSCQVVHDVASLDVTSMHHMFINGRYIPVKFEWIRREQLQLWINNVIRTPLEDILAHYHQPFPFAFHARVQFTNIRPKAESLWSYWGISLIPQSRFCEVVDPGSDWDPSETSSAAENSIRAQGFVDRARNAVFAFGKLVSADIAQIHLSELELWCVAQVYDFDAAIVQGGEGTASHTLPPDYVTLQSNMLFEQKTEMKNICKRYKEGEIFTGEISPIIPEGIAASIRDGSASLAFLKSYLQSSIKGAFNGIYGTQAMNLFRPDFTVDDGEIVVDMATDVTPATFQDKLDAIKHPRVLYTYGLRIVGGSRMHLVIALELLWRAFGSRITVTGGDTDSVKVACNGVTDQELLDALEPLHKASRDALNLAQSRSREAFPQLTSNLHHIGEFEAENVGHHYLDHMDLWNKARVSWDGEHIDVTCAGLSRPTGCYHIETFLEELMEHGHTFEESVTMGMGFNVNIVPEISHSLESHRPRLGERLQGTITDWMGNSWEIDLPQAIGLYSACRQLGDETNKDVHATLAYLERQGRTVEHRLREACIIDGRASVLIPTAGGDEIWS